VTGNLKTYAPNAKKIHIDIDSSEIHKNVRVDVPIEGDLKTVLNQMLPVLEPQEHKAWLGQIRDWMEDSDERDIVNQDVGNDCSRPMLFTICGGNRRNAVVVTDVGQHQMWEAQYYPTSARTP